MFDTMSCEADHLTEMYQNKYIYNTIMNNNVCAVYGLDFLTVKKKSRQKFSLIGNRRKKFILSIFPPVKIAALCNTLAIVHKKIVLNKAKRVYISDDLIINLQTAIPDINEENAIENTTKPQEINTSQSTTPIENKSTLPLSSYIEPIESQILPTKTFSSTDEIIVSSNIEIKESSTTYNENVTHASSSYTELNSTNEVSFTNSSQCNLYIKI